MITVLIRLLTLNAANVIPEVIWALCGIYVLAVLVTLTSVWVTVSGTGSKVGWSLVAILIPFLGVVLYCLRCLTQADLSMLKQFGFFSRKPL